MESKDNNNRSEDASGGVGETSGSAVKNECCDKQKADESENVVNKGKNDEKQKEEPIKNGNIPCDAGNTLRRDNENVENKAYDEKKIATVSSQNTERKDEAKNENVNKNEKPEKKLEKNEEVNVQKPKRTKSRRSLNKINSVNNIDVSVNGNASIQRTDR